MKIEKHIPLPLQPQPRGRRAKYPFGQMDVGDSFFSDEDRNRLAAASSHAGSRHGKKFIIRSVDGGFRIWRAE